MNIILRSIFIHGKHLDKAFVLALGMAPLLLCPTALAKNNTPLKVYVLIGQSNMQGHAKNSTLPFIGMDPKTKPWLTDLQEQDGKPKVFDDVRISYLSSNGLKEGALTVGYGADEDKLGPELGFGMTLHKKMNEPILIIKAAWGGKSLFADFRPPSSGVFKDKIEVSGKYYRQTIAHINDVLSNIPRVYPDYNAKNGYKLSGVVWFQGWNDMVNNGVYPNRFQPGGYDEYSKLLAQFIRDVRNDLSEPKLPFVIGVMGVNGPTTLYTGERKFYQGVHQYFRDAMAAPADLPEFKGNVSAVFTEQYWDLELSRLKAREAQVHAELKKIKTTRKLNKSELKQQREQLLQKEFTDAELDTLQKGISNVGFHYFGSGKVLTGIGIGFAEAMLSLIPQ